MRKPAIRMHSERRRLAAAGLFAMLIPLSGCMASQAQPTPVALQSGAIDTGTYPNLNVAPETAATPLSDEDKAKLTGRLAGAKARQASAGRGAGTRGDPARLRRLATSHGDETLQEIGTK